MSKQTAVHVKVVLLRVEKLPSHAVSPPAFIRVKWERGIEKGKQGTFPEVKYEQGVAEWLDTSAATASVTCNMIQKTSKLYKTKKLTFRVETFNPSQSKTKKTLGKGVINLSAHIFPPGKANTTVIIPLQNKFNTGTIAIELKAQPSNQTGNNINHDNSDDSDDMEIDLGDVDDDFVDRIVTESVAISGEGLSGKIQNSQELEKVIQIKENKKKQIENEIEETKKQIQQVRKETDNKLNSSDESSKLLREIREIEQKNLEKELKIQQQEIELSKRSNEIEKTMERLSNKEVEVMMEQLKIEDLKQEKEYLEFLQNEYQKTLEILKPQKKSGGNINAVAIFEQQLRFLKLQTNHYKSQCENYSEYLKELNEDTEDYKQRIQKIIEKSESDASSSSAFDEIPENFKEREFFLRREFLCDTGKYDSITKEPSSALKVIHYLHENRCEEEWIMDILLMIRYMAINAQDDLQMICYWFSVSLCITYHLQNSKEYCFDGEIKKIGILDDSTFDDEILTVQISLYLLNYELYLLLCKQIFPQIDNLLEVSFFSSMALIIDSSQTLIDPSRSVEGLIQLLTRLKRRLHEAAIYPVVIKQVFHQLVYYISTSLANRLLTTPELCTPTVALSIKMGLSFIEGWIQETSQSDLEFVEHCQ